MILRRIVLDGRYIADHFPGIGRYTYHLAEALARVSPESELILLYHPAQASSRFDLTTLDRWPNLRRVAIDVPTFSLSEQWRLGRIVGRLAPALFHAPYYIRPYWLPLPSVVTLYDVISARYPEYLPSPAARLAFEVTTRLSLATSQQVLTLSEASRGDLIALYGVRPDRITVTPLAADATFRPLPPDETEPVRARLGLPPNFILYLGINKPHKNLVRLVEAWQQVLTAETDSISSAQLVLAGREDPRYPQARQRAAELGLGERVRFLGDVAEADLPALYNLATLFVFPSLYEGWGLPVLEAMACGTPVVCGNRSSLPEVAGSAARLVDPADVGSIAGAIRELLSDPTQRAVMRQRGLEQAARFSWDRVALLTLEAYQKALLT